MYTLDAKEQQCIFIVDIGYDLIKAGKKQEALDLCDQFLKVSPNEYGIIRLKGQALEQLNRFKEAIVEYDKYLEVFSDDWNICFDKGFSYYSLEMYEEAIETFDEAFRMNPDNYDALKYKRLAENELYNTPGQKFNHRHHQQESGSEQYYHSQSSEPVSSEPSDLSELYRYQERKFQEEKLNKLRKQQRQENPVDSDYEEDYEQPEYNEEPMQQQAESEQLPKQINLEEQQQNEEPELSSESDKQCTISSKIKTYQQPISKLIVEQPTSLYSDTRYYDYHNALLYVLGLTITGSSNKSLFYSNRIKEKLIGIESSMIPEFYRLLHPIMINMYGDMQSQFKVPIPSYQIATSMQQIIPQLFSYDYDEGLLVDQIEQACIVLTNFFGQTIRRRCDPTLKVEKNDSMYQDYDKDRHNREDFCCSFYYELRKARIQIAQIHNVKLFESMDCTMQTLLVSWHLNMVY